MQIDIWRDFVCPWCYIGEKRLQRAMEELAIKDARIVYRAFELDPYACETPQFDAIGRLARKYGLSARDAERRLDMVARIGRDEGIDFKCKSARYTNTFNAHRLMKLGVSKNDAVLAEKLNFLLFDAFFAKNLMLAAEATLVDVGMAAGLDKAEILDMLHSDRFAEDVRADEAAAALGDVRSVPYFAFENGISIAGAAPYEELERILHDAASSGRVEGACGPKVCKF